MSKTRPVRWWRDDATRYRSRPPYVAPAADPSDEVQRWAFELIAVGSGIAELIAVRDRAIAGACGIPLELLGELGVTVSQRGGRVSGMVQDVTDANVERFKATLEREMVKECSPAARARLTRDQLVDFCARHNPARGDHAYGIATEWFINDELERRA